LSFSAFMQEVVNSKINVSKCFVLSVEWQFGVKNTP